MKNKCLGAHFVLKLFFGKLRHFEITLLLKSCLISADLQKMPCPLVISTNGTPAFDYQSLIYFPPELHLSSRPPNFKTVNL